MHQISFQMARVSFTLLFLGISFIQVLSIPGQLAHIRRTNGITSAFEVALTFVIGMWLVCGQVGLIYLWKIVGHMKESRFYSKGSLELVRRFLLTLKIASAIPILLFIMLIPQADDPGFFVLLGVVTLFILSLAVTTSLLRDQIEIKSRE